MLCAVCGCNNYNNKNRKLRRDDISYFAFPKDPKVLKKWIKFCKQGDDFKPKHKRICSDHFTKDDMERNLQFELGITDKKRFRLKPGSVPSVYKIKSEDASSERSARAQTKENKRIVKELLMESTYQDHEVEEEEDGEEVEVEVMETIFLATNDPDPIGEGPCEQCFAFKAQINTLHFDIQTTEQKCNRLLLNEIELKNKIKSLELELEQSKSQKKRIEDKLSTIFTSKQIQMLSSKDTKQSHWAEVDIAKSINLYSISPKAYQHLKSKDFPLPSVRTLQRWAQKFPQKYASCRKKASTKDLDEDHKECLLSIEGVDIENLYELMDTDTEEFLS